MRLAHRRSLSRSARTGVAVVAATAVLAAGAASTAAIADETTAHPGTNPDSAEQMLATAAAGAGLQMLVNERGRISKSLAATASSGSSELVVDKPAGATVRAAYLAYASTGYSYAALTTPLTLNGVAVPMTNRVANGIGSYNYFADVTDIVRDPIDAAAAGSVRLTVVETEPSLTEGEILVVIYDDPAVTVDQSVTVLYGALSPTGDTYGVRLARPVDSTDTATLLEMSLGITFSWQRYGSQYSHVDVNGQRLTSSAGGFDDGYDANGGLITVGGVGDSPENPADPNALPVGERSDDELYDLRPFVRDGDRNITVSTSNPSNDDNVMLATFTMNPPVVDIATDETSRSLPTTTSALPATTSRST